MTNSIYRPSRRGALGAIGAALLLPRQALAGGRTPRITGRAFGTGWQVIGAQRATLAAQQPRIETLFAEIDRQMSPWRADSTISRFNGAAAGWHAAEPELAHVAQAALDVAAGSGGAFDPTVGPLVAQWGFGPIAGGQAADWRSLGAEREALYKAEDNVTLDLCGIAKGRALDLAAELLREAGAGNVLIDLGGEFRAFGRHPSGRPWQVAVAAPGNQPGPVLEIADGEAVATSGLATQSYSLAGRRYGHIVTPALRATAATRLHSVSVVAGDAMTADAWATALFAAGDAVGPRMAEARGLRALFLFDEGAARRPVTTGGLRLRGA